MNPRVLLDLRLARPGFDLRVELSLPAQGVTVLFGPSGSGKTTLLRCVAGLERALGRVQVGEAVWQDSERGVWPPTWARGLGYVFQEASLFEHMTVRENLRYGMERVQQVGLQATLDAAIALLGIGGLLDRRPQALSGGERQRVAIARALATEPRILLLDEPLASLDFARRQEILPWLERLHHGLQIPVLYVTHAMEELTRLADHVVLMQQGQAVLQGGVAEVLSDPAFAARAGGEAGTVLHGRVAAIDNEYHLTHIDLDGLLLRVPERAIAVGRRVRVHVHANDVTVTSASPLDSSMQNAWPGQIEAIHSDVHPATCLLVIRHRHHRWLARVTRRAQDSLSLHVGLEVWSHIKSVAFTDQGVGSVDLENP